MAEDVLRSDAQARSDEGMAGGEVQGEVEGQTKKCEPSLGKPSPAQAKVDFIASACPACDV